METLDGLHSIDANKDSQIGMQEFLAYAQASPRINQEWLADTKQKNPCEITNAVSHYNHTLFYGRLGNTLRKKCRTTPYHRGDFTEGDYGPGYTLIMVVKRDRPGVACRMDAWKAWTSLFEEPNYIPCIRS